MDIRLVIGLTGSRQIQVEPKVKHVSWFVEKSFQAYVEISVLLINAVKTTQCVDVPRVHLQSLTPLQMDIQLAIELTGL